MAQRTVIASAALCALVLPAGWAASSSLAASPSSGATSSSSPAAASPTSSPDSPGASSSSTSTRPSQSDPHVDQPLRLHLDDKGTIDQGALPQPEALFTTGELKSVLPTLRSVSGDDGTITLDLPNESGDERSHLVITMKRFGKKADIEKAWASEKMRHQTRSQRIKGLYTFYRAGEHGVADAFTDGTTTHVLVTDGDAAGEIWFSGIGFGSLASTHSQGRATYRTSVTPKLVEMLGAKVRAGGAKPAETPAATDHQASPSSSTS